MSASKKQPSRKSVFPDTVVDHAWWTRYCTAEYFRSALQMQEIVIRLNECLVARAKAPGFSEEDTGDIETHGQLVEWLFDRIDGDGREVGAYIKEMHEKPGAPEGG